MVQFRGITKVKIRKIGLKSCKNFSNIGPTSMVLTKKKNKKQKHKITIVWNGKWEMGNGEMGENGGKWRKNKFNNWASQWCSYRNPLLMTKWMICKLEMCVRQLLYRLGEKVRYIYFIYESKHEIVSEFESHNRTCSTCCLILTSVLTFSVTWVK